MKLNIRMKALIVLAVFAAVVAGACGVRGYLDAQEAEAAKAAKAELEESVDIEGFEVSKLDPSAIEAIGGQEASDALEAQVATWCIKNVEGCGSATWNQRMKVDFKQHTVELGFLLDDEAKTQITVTAWPETARCTIAKGVSA